MAPLYKREKLKRLQQTFNQKMYTPGEVLFAPPPVDPEKLATHLETQPRLSIGSNTQRHAHFFFVVFVSHCLSLSPTRGKFAQHKTSTNATYGTAYLQKKKETLGQKDIETTSPKKTTKTTKTHQKTTKTTKKKIFFFFTYYYNLLLSLNCCLHI